MEKKATECNPLEGEHQANDKPAIDWALYHASTKTLTLRGRHETRKNQKKKINQ